jgi:hypothetical protein
MLLEILVERWFAIGSVIFGDSHILYPGPTAQLHPNCIPPPPHCGPVDKHASSSHQSVERPKVESGAKSPISELSL